VLTEFTSSRSIFLPYLGGGEAEVPASIVKLKELVSRIRTTKIEYMTAKSFTKVMKARHLVAHSWVHYIITFVFSDHPCRLVAH
jgi:hypothetical protein